MLRPAFPIVTRRLLLRPFVPGDVEAMHALESRPEVARYNSFEPRTLDEVRETLAARMQRTKLEADGDVLQPAVVLRATGALIGLVQLIWISKEYMCGEIGFMLHPDYHGRGLASEATAEMLRLGFEQLGLRRIIGGCDIRNVASARLMERLGMRREAHFRQSVLNKGEWCDVYVYGMLASEWAAATHGHAAAVETADHAGTRPASRPGPSP